MKYCWISTNVCYCTTPEGKFFAYDRLNGVTKYFPTIREAADCAEEWLLKHLKDEERIIKKFQESLTEFH